MPRTIKKSCAWSALVLAVGLAEKQEQEHREKVKMMQDQLDEQKLLINALLGMIQKQRQKQQVVQGAAEFQIQQAPRDINRVEGEQNVVPGSPVSVTMLYLVEMGEITVLRQSHQRYQAKMLLLRLILQFRW
ncbi:testis-expressed sequence 13A 13B-like [Sigmodon hispidus]